MDSGGDWMDFLEGIFAILFGDDHVINATEEFLRVVNEMTLPEQYMKYFNMTYTTETKEVATVPARDITQVSFLKRSFRYDDDSGRWIAPLEKKVMQEMVQWNVTGSGLSPEELTKDNVETSLAEMSLHDEEYFEEETKKLKKACWTNNIHPRFATQKVWKFKTLYTLAPFMVICLISCLGLLGSAQNPDLGGMRSELTSRCERILHRDPGENQTVKNLTRSLPDSTAAKRSRVAATENQQFTQDTNETTKEQIVKFEDPTVPEATITQKESALCPMSASNEMERTVKSFLQTPQKLVTFVWRDTDNRGDILHSFVCPQDIMQYKWWECKARNFTYLRAKIKITVRINTQPFQCGGLLACYAPEFAQYHTSFSHYTILPHQIVSAESGEVIELEIPFIQPYSHVDLTRIGKTVISEFRLIVASQLRSGSAEVSIWAHLTDVSLIGPQRYGMDPNYGTQRKLKDLYEEIENLKRNNRALMNMQCQVGDEDARGPVSGLASQVEQVARGLSEVPYLGVVARPIAAASGVVKGLAQALGLSKPTKMETAVEMRQQMNKGMAHHDMGSNSKKVTLNSGAQLQPGKWFGDDLDELAFKTMAQTPMVFDKFLIDVNNSTGSRVWSTEVTPMLNSITPRQSKYAVVPTPMAQVAQHFEYWSGGIVFCIVPYKTKYHSGSFRVVWTIAEPISSELDDAMAPRVICDFKSTTGCVFTVPYMSNTTMLKTVPSVDAFSTNGTIDVYVVNELKNGSTASSKIEFLVYACAANDMCFQAPRYPYTQVKGITYRIPVSVMTAPERVFTAQLGEMYMYDPKTWRADARKGFFPNPILSVGRNNAAGKIMETGGDPATSFKQLMNRFNSIPTPLTAGLTLTGWPAGPGIVGEMFNSFLFERGAMRYMLLPPTTFARSNAEVTFYPYRDNNDGDNIAAPTQIWYPDKEGPLELEVPYYNHRPFTRIRGQFGGSHSQGTTEQPSADYDNSSVIKVTSGVAPSGMYQAVGDDFQLGFYIGSPAYTVDVLPYEKDLLLAVAALASYTRLYDGSLFVLYATNAGQWAVGNKNFQTGYITTYAMKDTGTSLGYYFEVPIKKGILTGRDITVIGYFSADYSITGTGTGKKCYYTSIKIYFYDKLDFQALSHKINSVVVNTVTASFSVSVVDSDGNSATISTDQESVNYTKYDHHCMCPGNYPLIAAAAGAFDLPAKDLTGASKRLEFFIKGFNVQGVFDLSSAKYIAASKQYVFVGKMPFIGADFELKITNIQEVNVSGTKHDFSSEDVTMTIGGTEVFKLTPPFKMWFSTYDRSQVTWNLTTPLRCWDYTWRTSAGGQPVDAYVDAAF